MGICNSTYSRTDRETKQEQKSIIIENKNEKPFQIEDIQKDNQKSLTLKVDKIIRSNKEASNKKSRKIKEKKLLSKKLSHQEISPLTILKKDEYIQLQALIKGNKFSNPNDRRKIIEDPFDYPFCYIGQIQSLTNTGLLRLGTGTIISDSCVLTVAHNLIENPDREFRKKIPLENIIFCPLKTLRISCFGEINVIDTFIPQEYLIKGPSLENDWAILKLEKPIGKYIKTIFGHVNSLFRQDCIDITFSKINIIGFPGENEKFGRIYESSEGNYEKMDSKFESNFIAYKLDTSGGQSGSPVLVRNEKKYTIIAIHQRNEKKKNEESLQNKQKERR